MPPSQNFSTAAPDVLNARTSSPETRGPYLVATDGTDASTPALAMAWLLAQRGGEVMISSVVEPIPVLLPPGGVPIDYGVSDAARAHQQAQVVRDQARDVFGETLPSIDVTIGRTVPLLARIARERRAAMVIAGLRHHGRLDRMMLHRETPLAIAREARLPVLVVPQGTRHLPRIVVIAVDLDAASIEAARRARPLLGEVEAVFLVHVRGPDNAPSPELAPAWERLYTRLTQSTFERVTTTLGLPESVRVETRTLSGHPVEELLDFAEFARAELIVSGYHRRLLIDRLTGPRSVAERVFRGTTCAMLLVPERQDASQPLGRPSATQALTDPAAWAGSLAEFTRRNVGRVAKLEIDTLELGAQASVAGYALVGIEYDGDADAIRVMFGGTHAGDAHLTHGIPHPLSVELHRPREGPDLALRVAHAGGYTLLTFA